MIEADKVTRRGFVAAATCGAALAATGWSARVRARPAMARLVLDNDYSGDPDGLFQLAHHLLSPAVDIPLVVGSHMPANLGWSDSQTVARDAADKVHELLEVMQMDGKVSVIAGAELAIPARGNWQPSAATEAIVREAMRADSDAPFVYAAGAGLTELALAWLSEPRIGPRTRLVWIGGREHDGLAYPPPDADALEFNFSIDPLAAQIIFNESDIEIWQVPRNAYRQLLYSYAELRTLASSGPLGRYLVEELMRIDRMVETPPPGMHFPRTETYILGDSPLVTLTALQSFFQPDPSSSTYRLMPTPTVTADGRYQANPEARQMRVYTAIDTRLTFGDMAAKVREFDAR